MATFFNQLVEQIGCCPKTIYQVSGRVDVSLKFFLGAVTRRPTAPDPFQMNPHLLNS